MAEPMMRDFYPERKAGKSKKVKVKREARRRGLNYQ
jgi:hypothetical protein